MNVAPSVTFPCQPKGYRQKATNAVRNLNVTRAWPKIVCFLTQSVRLTLSSVQLTLLECVIMK